MRKIVILFSALLIMSLKQEKVEQEKYKFVLLSSEDWNELKKISVKGKNTVTVVDYKIRLDFISAVQYKSENVQLSTIQDKKLKEILKKYD